MAIVKQPRPVTYPPQKKIASLVLMKTQGLPLIRPFIKPLFLGGGGTWPGGPLIDQS